jgi:hypothetical protein
MDVNGRPDPAAFDYFLEFPLNGFRSRTPGPSAAFVDELDAGHF